jgi:[glutamine synthetase] adenylyltransferase / [glutamine synthetase]-adenylyl-L-tyrosine phosphorylase
MLPQILQASEPEHAHPGPGWQRQVFALAQAPRSSGPLQFESHVGAARADDWARGTYTSTRSSSARSILARLKPHILAAAHAGADAGELIDGFDSLVRRLSVGAHLFSSLAADPSALQTLLRLLTRAPRLAAKIAARPDFFDALIAQQPSADVMSAAALTHALSRLKHGCATEAEHLRAIQAFTRKHQLLVGARTVLGWTPCDRAAEGFSRLALAVVQSLAGFAERQFKSREGRVCGGEWALIGLGKLGGFELSATSDLDLMLVYEFPGDDQQSTGARPLAAVEYFNKLARHVIAVLGTCDTDGPLFETDFRLRPWGNKGPIATRLSTLQDYLGREAWTYERMAMTRASVVTGSARFAAEIETVIGTALHGAAAPANLRTDLLEMRALVHAANDTKSPWDIKHVRGGLMDIELLAQYLMLRHAHAQPCVIRPATADALRSLCAAGVLSPQNFETLADALSLFSQLMQVTRAACGSGTLPESMSSALASDLPAMLGEGSLAAVEARLRRSQAQVERVLERVTAA